MGISRTKKCMKLKNEVRLAAACYQTYENGIIAQPTCAYGTHYCVSLILLPDQRQPNSQIDWKRQEDTMILTRKDKQLYLRICKSIGNLSQTVGFKRLGDACPRTLSIPLLTWAYQ